MQRRDHKNGGIMESCIPSLEKNYITLSLKLVKHSCKCYDKYQALRKSSMSCWQNSFIRHVGPHPTTITFVWLQIFCFTLGWNQLWTAYESALGTLVMYIQNRHGHQILIRLSRKCHATGQEVYIGNSVVNCNVQ